MWTYTSPPSCNILFLTPGSNPSPSQEKEPTPNAPGGRAEDLTVSLDALAIARQASSKG